MFGFNQYGVNVYAKVSLETGVLAASPNKLIIMLYEGAITTCRASIEFMKVNDIQNKGMMLSNAIMIIESGLRLSLDKKVGGEIALSLDALYAYMSQRLAMANINNQPEPIMEVIKLLTELKSAWDAIDRLPVSSQAEPVVKAEHSDYPVNFNIANYARA